MLRMYLRDCTSQSYLQGLQSFLYGNEKNQKPTFIKVIWALLCLAEIATFVKFILLFKTNKFLKNGDYSGYIDLWPYYVASITITSALTSVAHWIFATQYLEVVLLLPLLLENGQADIKRKQQRVRWILNAANAYFFV